jgi:hypothetical protein
LYGLRIDRTAANITEHAPGKEMQSSRAMPIRFRGWWWLCGGGRLGDDFGRVTAVDSVTAAPVA